MTDMQDENQQQEQQEAEAQADEQAQAPAEEQHVEEPAAEAGEEQAAEAAGEAAAEPDAEAAEAAPPGDVPPVAEPEVLTPKQRRKLTRSRAGGPAGPQRSTADRARERAEARSRKGAERERWRARRREKRKGADSGTGIGGAVVREGGAMEASEPGKRKVPGAPSGKRKVRQGVVMSNKGDKTITVRIDRVGRHRVYGRVVRSTGTLHVHDERNEAAEGDLVRVIECRPLSRTKRWRLVEVLQKAR